MCLPVIDLDCFSKNSKSQAPNSKQIPNHNIQTNQESSAVWNFEFFFLGFVCYLEFEYWDFRRMYAEVYGLNDAVGAHLKCAPVKEKPWQTR